MAMNDNVLNVKIAPEWHEGLAQTLESLDSTDFPQLLVRALSRVVKFDHAVIFAYQNVERPLPLFDTFPPGRREVFVTAYLEGPYLLDPFFQACRDKVASGLYRMSQLAPDRFYQSEYYRSYYNRTGLAEEIGFFLSVPGDITIIISLMRTQETPAFTAREMSRLHLLDPVIRAVAQRHWSGLQRGWTTDQRPPDRAAQDVSIDTAFQNFGRPLLTPRECEVVGMVLRGHSSESIAQKLGIATGTVKIHRKNIYAKLGISSQSELFSQFISSQFADTSP